MSLTAEDRRQGDSHWLCWVIQSVAKGRADDSLPEGGAGTSLANTEPKAATERCYLVIEMSSGVAGRMATKYFLFLTNCYHWPPHPASKMTLKLLVAATNGL